jgi:hypothetical protein
MMYCVSFVEGSIELKFFFYHNLSNALKFQRDLLVIELNKLLDVDDSYMTGSINFDSCENNELQRLLNLILSLKYSIEYEKYEIGIELTEIKFEDEP